MKPLFKLLTLTAGAMAGNAALANQLCTVDYQETNNWGMGATHNVVVEYHGPGMDEWDFSWTFPGNEEVTDLWKGHFEQEGKQVGVIDVGYNGKVASGGTFDFGFNITSPSGNLPTEFFLNGESCGSAVDGNGPDDEAPVEEPEDNSNMPVMGWSLDNTKSVFEFVTVKNTDVAESHSFDSLQAYVSDSGTATLAIDLNTVETGISVRNQRVREHLFSADLLPTLYFTTQVDMDAVADLEPGQAKTMTIDGRLTLNGVNKDTTAEVLVIRSANDRIAVRTARPVIVSAEDFELTGGIEILRGLASLSAIGQTVPVYFNLNFSAIDGDSGDNLMPVEAGAAPAAPSIVDAAFMSANNSVLVSWQDLSDNESGFVIKRRQGDGYWETRGAVDANETQWSDQLEEEGNYTYRVIAVNESVPSTSSGNVLVNAEPDDEAPGDDDSGNEDPDQNPGEGDDGDTGGGMPGDGDGSDGDNDGGDNGSDDGNDGDNDGDNGAGPGNGDDDDAEELDGEEIYAQQCASCHGADGSGGAIGVSLTEASELSSLVSYIDTAMPLGNSGRCVDDCAEAVGEYISENIWAEGGSGDDPISLEDETAGPRQLNLMTRYHYANAVRDLLDVDASRLVENFPSEARVLGFSNNAAKNQVSARHLDEYIKAAERISSEAVGNGPDSLLSCEPDSQGCAEQFVEDFGLKAFRRPLSDDERQAYLSIFDGEGDFNEGMEAVIEGMLVSPNFLYISELGTETNSGDYELTPYEVASQLSFIYQGSIPDDALLAAAAADELSTPEQLEAQARRLLQTDQARVHIGHFAEQWLESDPASMGSKDPNLFPRFNGDVRDAMHKELREFFNHVVFESTGKFEELFTADYVFVNQPLANYYGLSGISGDQMQMVEDTTGTRGGVLAMGVVMASHGHANESAPIPRGNFVRRRLMCQDLPPPPEDLDTSGPEPDPNYTTRERFAERTGGEDCQTCHLYINGIGFGFEAFDGAGGHRTTDNNKPVDSYGTIHGLESLLEESSASYDGVREMQQLLVETDSLKSCMTKQFYRFSRGYVETSNDDNTLDNLNLVFANSGYDLQELMVGLTQLQTFTLRR